MTYASQKMSRKRLSWVEDARLGVLRAIGDDVINPQFLAFPTVDPLKFILKITLKHPLAKGTREPLRQYLRYWAEQNGCELPIIRINTFWVQAEILTQARVWSRDAKGKFQKGGKRFTCRPR